MKSNVKIILSFFFFLTQLYVCAQKEKPRGNIYGKWINKDNGIQIDSVRFVMLNKNDNWNVSLNNYDSYTFIKKPITNTSQIFESWVLNNKLNKEYIGGKYDEVKTKQFRVIKFEIQDHGKLKFYISNVARVYETDPNSIFQKGQSPSEAFIKFFNFEKLIQE